MLFRSALRPLLLAFACLPSVAQGLHPDTTWPTYGGDPGGQRYSPANQINKSNVNRLTPAWTFHTGALLDPRNKTGGASFEATPILFKGSLYLSSPYDQVFAVDPLTGTKRWSYDPHLDWTRNLGIITSRGVASWSSAPAQKAAANVCADRIFLGTLDGRLIALDAATGQVCTGFGVGGSVDLTQNVDYRKGDDYAVTSPPTVIGDVVVVGAGVEDNARVDIELGDVRGFDVRTGKLIWTWEPMPWAKKQTLRTGAGNTWAVIAADPEHGLLYLPTSSPSPDYYGGLRPGDNRDADSIVALDAKTGRKVWAFQVVHHNIWDYDIAAEPLLFTFRGKVPAVAVSTKMGIVFVFNRLTGEPLYPIHEKAVPQSDVRGETSSPTQPFPDLPPLAPLTMDLTKPLGLTPADDAPCRKMIGKLRYTGLYSPPSIQGTILYPSNVGGVNWGSAALDPASGILYANVNRVPFVAKLQKRPWIAPRYFKNKKLLAAIILAVAVLILLVSWRLGGRVALIRVAVVLLVLGGVALALKRPVGDRIRNSPWLDTGGFFAAHFGKEYGENSGSPYVLLRQPFTSGGEPCAPTPWGTVSALNLNTGTSAWETTLGTVRPGMRTGTMSVGGPIVTAGGLVFTAASEEPLLRAFDAATGEEVWDGKLPAPAQATPMTYVLNGRQYIVVAAGGHYTFGTAQTDSVVAFALP